MSLPSKRAYILKQRTLELTKYNPSVLEMGAWALFLAASTKRDKVSRLKALNHVYAWAKTSLLEKWAHRSIQPYLEGGHLANSPQSNNGIWSAQQIGWERYDSWLKTSKAAGRTLLLKEPGPKGEKGVIFSYFEYNWLRIFAGIRDFAKFNERYTLILAPSWSPGNYNLLALALEKISGPVFLQCANLAEREKFARYHPRIVPLDSLACAWLDPAAYQPKAWDEREIDLLVVANWAPFKRHWHLFDVLSRLPDNLRVTCIGQPESGRGIDDIRRLQKQMGARQEIDYRQSLPIEEVIRAQVNSKLATVFSLREGGCVAAAEALMANTPLVLLEGAHIGSSAYVNESTGALLKPGREHIQIADLLKNGHHLNPRQWALQHISCQVTTESINAVLKRHAQQNGEAWTRDIEVACYRPYPSFQELSNFDKLTGAADELSRSYPEVFPAGWMRSASR